MMTCMGPVKNTDREIWRREPDDYYSPSIFVTDRGDIGISISGYVATLSVEEWHAFVWTEEKKCKAREAGLAAVAGKLPVAEVPSEPRRISGVLEPTEMGITYAPLEPESFDLLLTLSDENGMVRSYHGKASTDDWLDGNTVRFSLYALEPDDA